MSRGSPPATQTENHPTGEKGDPQAEGEGKTEAPVADRLSSGRRSARATMATFLSAIDEAERGQVERYVDALACLDLSGLAELPENARVPRGRKLASLLNEFIDKHGIELELIPEDLEGEAYTYHVGADGQPAIQIRRYEGGVWLFTAASLAFVENGSQEPVSPTGGSPVPADSSPVRPGGSPAGEAVAAKAERQPPAERAELQPAPAEPAAGIPSDFRSARATMRTFRKAIKEGRVADAAECLDLSDYPVVIRSEKGVELTSLLHEAINRTKPVVLQELPDDPNHNKPLIFRQDELGIIVIARQADGDDLPGHWLFTKQTVAGLDSLYEALLAVGEEAEGEDEAAPTPFSMSLWLRSRVPESLKETWLLLKHWQWLGLLALALLGIIARRLTTALLRAATGLWFKHREVTVAEAVQVSSLRPVGILAASAVWWVGLTWLALRADVLAVLLFAVKFIACWATVWTVYRAVDLLGDYFASLAGKTDTKIDDLLVPFARKVAKVLVTILGIIFIVEQFTADRPLELLAGLGLGGLALALAAQDTLKNLFGSLTVIADRPFKVGDWVLIGDIEGTIESVGFRSTRVRTFYNSQLVVPNANLMSATIDNYGARRYRRIKVMLSLTYSTPPEKIEAFCEGIRELIRLHPYTRKDYYHVYFNKFGASSLDMLLYCFLEAPDWATELRERHHLFCDILRLAAKLGVAFAYPTQTVWLQRSREAAQAPEAASVRVGRDEADVLGFDQAAKVFEEAYGAVPAHRDPVVIDVTPRSKRSGRDDPGDDSKPT